MLEKLITESGHYCIFLPKFHCELNLIEMVCVILSMFQDFHTFDYSTGVGANITAGKYPRKHFRMLRMEPSHISMPVHMSFQQLCLEIHECILNWIDWQGSRMGCKEAVAALSSLCTGNDAD
jgi:hypothetical protein